MQLTQEQRDAIHIINQNLVVTAGAGSGKTFVLVHRFMQLLEKHPDWSLPSLVAITFTDKAAREMRDRVRQEISNRLENYPSNSSEARFWRSHEATLDSARISTIHSLCAQILRANAVEAGLDPKFELLDEVETALLLDEAIQQALTELITLPASALLVEYQVYGVSDTLRELVRSGQTEMLVNRLAGKTIDDLMRDWQAAWGENCIELIEALRSDGDFWDLMYWPMSIPSEERPTQDKLWQVWEEVLSYRHVLKNGSAIEVIAALEHIRKAINLTSGSDKHWQGRLQESKDALRMLRDEKIKAYQEQFLPPPSELDERLAQLLFYWRDAALLAENRFRQLKEERGVLDFNDLEVMTAHLLNHYPKMTQRYAEEYKHIMVDEFQDTNQLQRQIIYRLCGITLNGKQAPAGRLFVVGDPKQSIYAFRGADVSVFRQVSDEIIQTGGRQLHLSTSFRSHQNLVGCINDIFGQLLQVGSGLAAPYTVGYTPMNAARPSDQTEHRTPVTMVLLPKSGKTASGLDTEETRRWEAHTLAETIAEWIASARQIWDKQSNTHRSLKFGDIAVLFQALTNSPIYEEALQANGLPYLTVAGKGYYDRQEVWDVQNLLRALHNPSDDLSLASALRSPLFSFSDEALLTLRLRKKNGETLHLWDALFADPADWQPDWLSIPPDDVLAVEFARQTLAALQRLAGRVTIAELIEHILAMTGFEATLTGLPNGEKRRANVQKLLTVAEKSQRISLGEFNTYLRDMVEAEAREGEATLEAENAITLMTVHASKGLEYPVVILADCSWGRQSRKARLVVDPIAGPACKLVSDNEEAEDADKEGFAYQLAHQYATQRELAERRRVLYVAATRAQDTLIISGQATNAKKDWLGLLRDALNLIEPTPDDALQSLKYNWGNLNLLMPATVPDPHQFTSTATHPRLWEEIEHHLAAAPIPQNSAPHPALELANFDATNLHRAQAARHINATDLEKLGRAKLRDQNGQQAFRQKILRDMPSPIWPVVAQSTTETVPAYVVGDIVHRALRVGLLPRDITPEHVAAALESYAWERYATDQRILEDAVEQAQKLLVQFEASDLHRILRECPEVYREIEFVYDRDQHIIHGIIDVLYRHKGRWHVLDFKTSQVKLWYIPEHGKRYAYQMGAYAEAVKQQTGQTPEVQVYYLRPGILWTMPDAMWQAAMTTLDEDIEKTLWG